MSIEEKEATEDRVSRQLLKVVQCVPVPGLSQKDGDWDLTILCSVPNFYRHLYLLFISTEIMYSVKCTYVNVKSHIICTDYSTEGNGTWAVMVI